MSRFSTKTAKPKAKVVRNEAGGTAYNKNAKLELVSLLLTSFVQDQYYRIANTQLGDIDRLLTEVPSDFAAKAAIYARDKFHMRSITHALAAKLAPYASGTEWGTRFYDKIVERPDDITEILAAWYAEGNTVTSAMRKGLRKAFEKFNEYELAKYRGTGKSMSLIDAVRIVHPKPNSKNKTALHKLVHGSRLKSTKTWEAKMSAAGNDAEAKAEVWSDLVTSGKIGYFALLRNLRNILEQNPKLVDRVCELLTDHDRVVNSKVLPFRFTTALENISLTAVKIRKAIDEAMTISLANVPMLTGRTLVAVDHSGSMDGRPRQIANLFGAVLALRSTGTVVTFSDHHAEVKINRNGTIMAANAALDAHRKAGGTDFYQVFGTGESYDRIIILSDMQPWIEPDHYYNASRANCEVMLADYKARTGADPDVWTFDLAGHSTTQFKPDTRTYHLAGFSEAVFDIMTKLGENRNALVSEVEAIEL